MKPRCYFWFGSALLFSALIGFSLVAVFLINLTIFSLRQHGPMGQWRLELMLASFPWWLPPLVVFGAAGGIYLLKKYDFSYRKNFLFIVLGFILAIVTTAYLIDHFGFNEAWSRRGSMRRFYRQIEPPKPPFRVELDK